MNEVLVDVERQREKLIETQGYFEKAMILSTIGGILLALGMCMTLLPEWNAFKPGVAMGCIGLLVLLVMMFVWRKMENKEPIKLSRKTIGATLILK